MKFTTRQFSKRYAAIECAVFVIHEPILIGARIINGATSVTVQPITGVHRGTAAAIVLPDGRFWIGVTLCSPRDQFIKAVGRAKAIGRAYQALTSDPDSGDWLGCHGKLDMTVEHKEVVVGFLKDSLQRWIDEAKRQMRVNAMATGR